MLLDELTEGPVGNDAIEREIRRRKLEAELDSATRDSAASTGSPTPRDSSNPHPNRGSLKTDAGRELFTPDQKAKLRDNPELRTWFDSLSRNDQISREAHREINNYGTQWASTTIGWDPKGAAFDNTDRRLGDLKPDNVVGSSKSHPFRMGGTTTIDNRFLKPGDPGYVAVGGPFVQTLPQST